MIVVPGPKCLVILKAISLSRMNTALKAKGEKTKWQFSHFRSKKQITRDDFLCPPPDPCTVSLWAAAESSQAWDDPMDRAHCLAVEASLSRVIYWDALLNVRVAVKENRRNISSHGVPTRRGPDQRNGKCRCPNRLICCWGGDESPALSYFTYSVNNQTTRAQARLRQGPCFCAPCHRKARFPWVAVSGNYVRKTSHNVQVKSKDTPCPRSPLRKLDCHVNTQWLPSHTSPSGKRLFRETEILNTLSEVCALSCISLLWIPDCKVNIVVFNIPDGWKLHYERT